MSYALVVVYPAYVCSGVLTYMIFSAAYRCPVSAGMSLANFHEPWVMVAMGDQQK
jgi:hypothetical protein